MPSLRDQLTSPSRFVATPIESPPRDGVTWPDHILGPRDRLPDQVEQWLEWLSVLRNRPATTVRSYRQDVAKFVALLATEVDMRGPGILD